MDNFYLIGEAARRAGVTIETLRHYDRIGLVPPCKIDPQTGYRYYSDIEIAKAQIAYYLRSIKLSLPTIKKLFSEDDIPALTDTFRLARKKVDAEIEHLLFIREHLQDTLDNYSTKKNTRTLIEPLVTPVVRELPASTIFLAQDLHAPTLDNLMQLHDRVEGQISPEVREQFRFENAVGALIQDESCTLFALCLQSGPHPNVATLPAGQYLCTYSPAKDYKKVIEQLRKLAAARCQPEKELVIMDVVFTGIIQWEYEIKLFLSPQPPKISGL